MIQFWFHKKIIRDFEKRNTNILKKILKQKKHGSGGGGLVGWKIPFKFKIKLKKLFAVKLVGLRGVLIIISNPLQFQA